jgi:hypothetical protein
MSCVETLEETYPAFTYKVSGGSVLERDRVGIIRFNIGDILPIEYHNIPPKRLKVKIKVNLSYSGLSLLQEYRCLCGGGISKIVVFVKNPFKQVAELVDILMQIQIIILTIQLLTSIFTFLT